MNTTLTHSHSLTEFLTHSLTHLLTHMVALPLVHSLITSHCITLLTLQHSTKVDVEKTLGVEDSGDCITREGFVVAFGGEPLLLEVNGAGNHMTWDDEGALESWKVRFVLL